MNVGSAVREPCCAGEILEAADWLGGWWGLHSITSRFAGLVCPIFLFPLRLAVKLVTTAVAHCVFIVRIRTSTCCCCSPVYHRCEEMTKYARESVCVFVCVLRVILTLYLPIDTQHSSSSRVGVDSCYSSWRHTCGQSQARRRGTASSTVQVKGMVTCNIISTGSILEELCTSRLTPLTGIKYVAVYQACACFSSLRIESPMIPAAGIEVCCRPPTCTVVGTPT